MAGIPSRMNQTAREQVLATDLNRIGDLAGRELMDSKLLRSTRADFYKPSTNSFDDFAAVSKAAQATPIAGLTCPPSLDGIAAVFDMALGAGEGQLPFTSTNPDQSDYQLLRWDAQTITWPGGGTPDATNPLICLIVATPADGLTDLQSRNILLDPILRTVSPQNVYKTTNPVATISVIAGAAAAAPVPPAVPAGALALFEVFVPPTVADSTSFLPVRRAWRQIEFPGTSQHGIVKNCEPNLQTGTPYLGLGLNFAHRLVIDGELLVFLGAGSATAKADTVHPPTAPTGYDKPYFLYLCGGRNRPVLNYSFLTPGCLPIPAHLVISATAPDPLGYPVADLGIVAPTISFPRAACCYIGVCFMAPGGANVPAVIDGDWIRAATLHNFLQPTVTLAAAAYTAIPMPTVPATSTAMRVRAIVSGGASSIVRVATAADDAHMIIGTNQSYGLTEADTVTVASLYYKDLISADTLEIRCCGFNMNIPRLAR